jgi:hypothetical protein
MQHLNKKKGFASLIGVIFMSIVILAVIILGAILSIDVSRSNKNTNDAIFVLGVLNSCAENALDKLKTDINYAGNESFVIDGITCNILAISGTGNTNRILKISAVSPTALVKKVQIDINTVNPYYIMNYWQEVPDFY